MAHILDADTNVLLAARQSPAGHAHDAIDALAGRAHGDAAARSHLELLQAIRFANDAVRAGHISPAMVTYGELLRRHASQPAVWFGLAGAHAESGEHGQALACLERAARLRPACATYQIHLGEAYRAAGRAHDAAAALGKALLLEPGRADTLLALALASFECGAREQGARLLRQACAVRLDAAWRGVTSTLDGAGALLATAIGNRGERHRGRLAVAFERHLADRHLKRRRPERAESACRRALQAAPSDRRAALLLGRALIRQERHLEARDVLERLVAAQTVGGARDEGAAVLTELGIAHLRCFEFEAAALHLSDALRLAPGLLRANRHLGWALLRLERHEEAMVHFAACRSRNGRLDPDAAYGIATALQTLGRFEESALRLREALDADPRHSGALLMLLRNERGERTPANLERARNLTTADRPARYRINAHFAAAIVEDELGHPDEAFGHYATGNALKDVVYDAEAMDAAADEIIAAFPRAALWQLAAWGNPSRRPIFIVGMPRSGSTLVEQILASHPEVAGGGELRDIPAHVARLCDEGAHAPRLDREQLEELTRSYLHRLAQIDGGAAHVTDKMLFNFWHLGVIAAAFPNATIIETVRDPMDCCTSIFLHDFAGQHGYAYSLENLGHYWRVHRRLMAHWHEVLPGRITTVRYEDMVADAPAQMRRLVAACGLAWDEGCARFHAHERPVSTSSYAQVRQPIYGGAVGKWRRYERHLEPLRRALCLASLPDGDA